MASSVLDDVPALDLTTWLGCALEIVDEVIRQQRTHSGPY